MTARKPPDIPWESWVDRQIRESMERGEFDDLPGSGKPLAGLDEPDDELWWVKRKLEREGLAVLVDPAAERCPVPDPRPVDQNDSHVGQE